MASQYIQYAVIFLLGLILVVALGVPFSNIAGSMSEAALVSRLEAVTLTTEDYIEHLNERVIYNGIQEARFTLSLPRYISNQAFTLTIYESFDDYFLLGSLKNNTSVYFNVPVGVFSGYSISGLLNSEKYNHYIVFYSSQIVLYSE